MVKQRVLVMNGSRLVEADVNGTWKVQKVEPAGNLKAGIYNIFNAKPADTSKSHSGVILHADKKEGVFQEVAKGQFVSHSATSFEKLPKPGERLTISYQAGIAQTAEAAAQKRGRSR
jgi:hypothetical protein